MAKRVNTSFVTSVGAVIFIGLGLVAFGPKLKARLLRPQTAIEVQKLRAQADDFVAKRQLSDARDAINSAWLLDRTDKELCLRRGDILAMLTEQEGQEVMQQARISWQNALEIDPKYSDAARRLMDSYADQMEIAPTPQVCFRLREAAARCLQIDPNDARSTAYLHIATIQQWVQGTPKTELEITQAITVLEELLKKDPSAADVMFYLIRGKAYRAAEDARSNRPEAAQKAIADCRATLAAAVEKYSDSPAMNFRVFQGYVLLTDADRDPDQVARDRADANAAIERARVGVKDSDPRYADFQYVAADWAHRNGRDEESEKILREFYTKRPHDQRARLALARRLGLTGDPAKRDEAIEILSQRVELTGETGVRATHIREMESQTLLDLTSFRISLYPTLPPSQRPEMMKKIDDGYARVETLAVADSIPVLRLKGLIYQLKRDFVEAVASLSRAKTLLEHSDPKNPIKWDLMYQLATANREAGQNKAAEKLLAEIVDRFNAYLPAHEQLAELYLESNSLESARRQIDEIAELKPGLPDVLRFRVALAQRAGHREEAEKLYGSLPEIQFSDKLAKAQVAANLGNSRDAIRLLSAMQLEKPDDSSVTIALIQEYNRSDDRKKGLDVLEAGLKRNPKDERLVMYKRELNSATPGESDSVVDQLAGIGDPFYRAIQAGRIALSNANYNEVRKHAADAEQIRHDDPATWDLYFQTYKREQNWEMAEKALESLTRLNADHANGLMYRWSLAMARAQWPEAIGIGRQLTVERESFGQSWILLAEAYQANAQFSEALSEYRAALERQTTNIDAYKGMADCYVGLGQSDRARDVIATGQKMFPDNLELREWAWTYDAKIDAAKVIPLRRQVLAQQPDEPENYIALAGTAVQAGKQCFAVDPIKAKGFIDQASDTLTKGVGRFPDNLRLNAALAETLQNAGRVADGAKILRELSERPAWKGKPEPLLVLSDYYTHSHDAAHSEQAIRDALDRGGAKSVDIQIQLATQLEQQGRFDDALKVLEANAADPRIVSKRLQCHITAGHTDAARKGLAAALAKNPDNIDLLNLLTVVNIDAYQYPEARAIAAHVLKLDPRNDVATYYQALVELRDPVEGDLPLALKNLQLVTLRSPRSVLYKLEYANALSRIKDIDGMTVQIEDAMKLDPFNRNARIRLLELYSLQKKWSQFEKVVTDAELNPAMADPAIWARTHAYGLSAQEQFPQAIAKIREAIAMEPRNPMFGRDYLVILLQAKDYQGVIGETQRLMDAGVREWWMLHMRGVARIASGKMAEGFEQLDKAMVLAEAITDATASGDAYQQVLDSFSQVSPDEALARVMKRNAIPRWRLQCVSLMMRKHDFAGALVQLAPLIEKKTMATLTRSERISTLRFAAECNQYGGHPESAKAFYLDWLQEAPNDPTVLNNLACLLAENLHQPEEARQYSQRAFDLGRKVNLSDPMVVDTQGWVLTLCGGAATTEGLTILSGLVDTHGDFLDARYHLAMAYLKVNRPADAAAELSTAVAQIKALEEKKLPVNPDIKAQIMAAADKAKTLSRAGD
ncbi:MAG TPA: tetratricopeptide repeat protein [Tepidisphaeraceae bacterium]|jgi:tetratricopeptide (TPR) repeat protein|nr:tetratricopeptide repeat protein [Tepidisphaeraceae bacterium]